MVIVEDLRKLLLYQKLNLGFECQSCKKKFYNRIDHLEHTNSCGKVPDLKCSKCGKVFGHVRILQLHLQFHNMSEALSPQSPEVEPISGKMTEEVETTEKKNNKEDIKAKNNNGETTIAFANVKKLFEEPSIGTNSNGDVNNAFNNAIKPFKIFETSLPKRKSSQKAKEKPKTAVKKPVGLTKIKMEDCLRCDACSCIYIDEKDYYKHMRNFHQRGASNVPMKQQKSKRKCQSCKQCRGSQCSSLKRPRASQHASDLIFRFNMKDNIKNRWSQMVSQLSVNTDRPIPTSSFVPSETELMNIKPDPDVNIKQEPEPDFSYLLSQVEVKIKTEPPDDY